MAHEIPNQKVIDRYKELLASRTHDVIVRDAAIELLEENLRSETDAKAQILGDYESTKSALDRANETIRLLQDKIRNEVDHPPKERSVIKGEVVE